MVQSNVTSSHVLRPLKELLASRTETSDSGVESADENPTPDEATLTRIVSQVEFLLSDENLRRDVFVLKHIKRNRDGYVSLKLIASLRRVKAVAKDWKDAAVAVRRLSKSLALNAEGNKVRRVQPLPLDLLLQSRGKRMVLLHGLQDSREEAVRQTLSCCGSIVSIRSCEQDSDCVKSVYPDLRVATAALVEFESVDEAVKGIKTIEQQLISWRKPLSAVLFGDPLPRPLASSVNLNRTADKRRSLESSSSSSRMRSQTMSCGTRTDTSQVLRRKSRSCNAFDVTDFRRLNIRQETPVHRQPLGPDGTRGFHKKAF